MITYKTSGVDIKSGDEFVRWLKKKSPVIGGFGGLFHINPKRWEMPVLVASTDGVGTKLLIAEMMNRHNTIGIDLVAMVVNDIAVCGAKPLFFLDYYATGKLQIGRAREIMKGIIEGCRQSGCTLLGGETAELPGMYAKGIYDLAGFGIGVVEKKKVVDGSTIRNGDIFIGVESSGLHSNGYSLVRRVLLEKAKLPLKKVHPRLKEKLGETLLRPTIIYSPLIEALMKRTNIKGMAHITGGGIPGNLCRVLPKNINAMIDKTVWQRHPIFAVIQETGPVPEDEMFRTFNMGVGLIIAVEQSDVRHAHHICRRFNLHSYDIGEAVAGNGTVQFKG